MDGGVGVKEKGDVGRKREEREIQGGAVWRLVSAPAMVGRM